MRFIRTYQPSRLHMVVLSTICLMLAIQLWTISRQPTTSLAPSQSLVALNPTNGLVMKYAAQMQLAPALERYDQVILALEQYYRDQQEYPTTLSQLVPTYLAYEPVIYIRYGETLYYAPATNGSEPTFTFSIYGHYPGWAFLHGWFVKYCPVERQWCGESSDRHITPSRINPRWMWVSSSAL